MSKNLNVIQVVGKGMLDKSFYGQIFVTYGLMRALDRYGIVNQDYFFSTSRTKSSQRYRNSTKTIDLETRLLKALNVKNVIHANSSAIKLKVDQLSKLITEPNTVIQYHEPGDASLAAHMRRKFGSDIKQYLTWHMTPEPNKHSRIYLRNTSMNTGPAFDGFVAVSNFVKKKLLSIGFPSNRVVQITNGLDSELYRVPPENIEEQIRDSLNLSGKQIVSYLGRIEHFKGKEVLKGLLERSNEWLKKDVVFLISSPNQNEVQSFMNYVMTNYYKLAKEEKIKFVIDISKYTSSLDIDAAPRSDNYIDREKLKTDLVNHYKEYFFSRFTHKHKFKRDPHLFSGIVDYPIPWISDVGIFPTYWEALGLVALEYVSAGVPLVSSKVGGAVEVVKAYSGGQLINIPDKVRTENYITDEKWISSRNKELEGVISEFINGINNALDSERISPIEGRSLLISKGWSLDSMAAKYLDLYNSPQKYPD